MCMACYHFCKLSKVLACTCIKNSLEEWTKNSDYIFGHGNSCWGRESFYCIPFNAFWWMNHIYIPLNFFFLIDENQTNLWWRSLATFRHTENTRGYPFTCNFSVSSPHGRGVERTMLLSPPQAPELRLRSFYSEGVASHTTQSSKALLKGRVWGSSSIRVFWKTVKVWLKANEKLALH